MLFGEMLIDAGAITAVQLEHGLEVQKAQQPNNKLGEILMQLGYLTPEALDTYVQYIERQLESLDIPDLPPLA